MRRKALFVAPRAPYPLDTGGKIRTYHLLRLLSEKYSVRLLCFVFSEHDEKALGHIRDMGVEVFFIRAHPWFVFVKKMVSLLLCRPVSLSSYMDRGMKKLIFDAVKEGFAYIHFDHLHMGRYAFFVRDKGVFCVMDEHNVEYLILERGAAGASGLKRLFWRMQARAVKAVEKKACAIMDELWVVSGIDRDVLASLSGQRNIKIVPNGVDPDFFYYSEPRDENDENTDLVFVGSMDWLPNEDACLFMVREIMPILWEKAPEMRLFLVGRNPSQRLKSLASDKVIVTGSVEDVRPYVYKARVYVAPLRFGSGSRLKILEAMAMGRPIVSTSLGAEGIGYTDERDILIADSPKDFSEKVLCLCADRGLAKSIALRARKLVEERYSWRLPE